MDKILLQSKKNKAIAIITLYICLLMQILLIINDINGAKTVNAKFTIYFFLLSPLKYPTVKPQFGQMVPIRDSISWLFRTVHK